MASLWSLNYPKIAFFPFCADLNNKFRPVKSIYIYAPESSHYTLSENENDIVYIIWFIWVSATFHEILAIKI